MFKNMGGWKIVRMHDSIAYEGCTLYFFRAGFRWKQYIVSRENGRVITISQGTSF
jgi:hypothetical protein